jgi:hypothetical protein
MTNQANESIVRDTAGQPGIQLAQTGWRISDRDGDIVGTVVGRDGTSMKVDLEGGAGGHLEIPTQLIAEEDEGHMQATLAVSSDELMRAMPSNEVVG